MKTREMTTRTNRNFNKKYKSEDSVKQKHATKGEKSDNFSSYNYDLYRPEKWYNEVKCNVNLESTEITYEEIDKLKREASSIYREAVILNNSKPPKSISNSDYSWIKTVMSKGTKTDKIAAYTILIQDCPLYNMNLLKNMVEMVKVGKKKECFMAVDTLSELFLNDLLPPNRKLLLFAHQPLSKLDEITSGNTIARKRKLLLWYFEEELKSIYGEFVNYLNKIAHDSVEANKEKVITIMCKLLKGNPEKENLLLNNIVNKLGDPSHKVGSKVIYELTKLLESHPNMREVVVDAVEKVIFRTNISKRAQYYSVCFLSQFCLFNGDSKLAKKLILIYLSLFKACIKLGDVDSRMMGALLTGVNRAYPYAKDELDLLKDHINTIYKVIHLSNSNVAIQALSLIYLICNFSNAYTDRFFCVLYKKIAELEMFNSSHHAMFLSLIYKSLRNDQEKARILAFIKRLFQVCPYVPIPVACGILIMISEIMRKKKDLVIHEIFPESKTVLKFEDDSDDGEEHYEDVKEDEVQTSENLQSPVKEVKHNFSNIENMCNVKPLDNMKVSLNQEKFVETMKDVDVSDYNPFVRNPLYAGANHSFYFELYKLSQHFHPTVSLFANKIINGEPIIYSGDPLLDFTTIRFLDKFSFKNPKALKSEEEKNLTFSKFGRKKYYSSETVRRLRANTADYLNHSEKNIPADEIFLYRYMKNKFQKIESKKKEEDSDLESVGSNEFEEMLDGLADGKKDDIDFLSEVGQLPKKSKKEEEELDEEEEEEDDEEEEEDEEEDESEEDADTNKKQEFSDLSSAEDFEGDEIDEFNDDDEEMQGSDLDEAELEAAFGFKLPNLSKVQKKNKNINIKKKSKNFKDNLFASAEEFSELLEEQDFNAGSSEAFSNKDRAGIKQLKWESERDKWIHKKNYRSKNTNFKKNFKKTKSGIKKHGRKKDCLP